jgi:aspartate/methionine/tyrosine aminotransferase
MEVKQMLKSRLPLTGGGNIFAEIKAKKKELLAQGREIFDFSVGIPPGSSSKIACGFAALAYLVNDLGLAGYQDEGSAGADNFFGRLNKLDVLVSSDFYLTHDHMMFTIAELEKKLRSVKDFTPANFSKEFCLHHLPEEMQGHIDKLDFAPTIGTKQMLSQVIMACGTHKPIKVAMMTKPGYPTPAFWGGMLKNVEVYQLPLNRENSFVVNPHIIPADTDLLMIQYPNNPSGQYLAENELDDLCEFCAEKNIRIFNDNPYSFMAPPEAATLTEVAAYFDVSHMEAFSFSKEGANHTGWGVGAVCGSKDFVADYRKIKGDVDSGFNVNAAIGALATLRYDMPSIRRQWDIYQERQRFLRDTLTDIGLLSVGTPRSTFFSLWDVPSQAFGRRISDGRDFFEQLIENTGIIIVPFGQYVRFAVISDKMDEHEFREKFRKKVKLITPEYTR